MTKPCNIGQGARLVQVKTTCFAWLFILMKLTTDLPCTALDEAETFFHQNNSSKPISLLRRPQHYVVLLCLIEMAAPLSHLYHLAIEKDLCSNIITWKRLCAYERFKLINHTGNHCY